MFVRKWIVALTVFMATSYPLLVDGQTAYVNSPFGLFELTGAIGSCTATPIPNGCGETGTMFSLALHKDTMYYNTGAGQLKRFKLGSTVSCEVLVNVGSMNSMTVDKNGIVYLTDNRLHRYNPYTNTLTTLGTMPFGSAGDLFFFNDKLLLAGSPAGIYEINIANPAASTLYMTTNGIPFYGLISFPESCSNIRFFGLAPVLGGTNLVELDLVNKQVLGTVCTIPMSVLDAASVTETGLNTGITIMDLGIGQPCPPAATGSLTINAFPKDDLTFTLDNNISNTTGLFTGLAIGSHHLKITTSNGCMIDTTFKIAQGLGGIDQVITTNPDNCDANNGTVKLSATSVFLPLTYSWINTGTGQSSGEFSGIAAGMQQFRVTDAAGCAKDSLVNLVHQPKPFISDLEIRDAHCMLNNGWIKINLTDAGNQSLTSLNNSAFVPTLEYQALAPGNYYLQIQSGTHCYYDTNILITNVNDSKPQVTISKQDQVCFTDNGVLNVSVMGVDAPYLVQVNNGGYAIPAELRNLAPGNYQIDIKNKYDCVWDSFAVIQSYPRIPYFTDIKGVNPTCRGIVDGALKITITGTQGPYLLELNGLPYENGKNIENLGEGEYKVKVINADACIMDTLVHTLTIPFESHCVDVYMPNAFTPNGDGKNDRLKPAYSSFIKDVRMKIFNRNGQLLFEGRGSSANWDGWYNGMIQPSTIYIYTITYTDHQNVQRLLKGHVALIR